MNARTDSTKHTEAQEVAQNNYAMVVALRAECAALKADNAQLRAASAVDDQRIARLREALEAICTAKRPLDWSPSVELAEAFAKARAALGNK